MALDDHTRPANRHTAAVGADTPGEIPCTHTAVRRAARQLGKLYDDAVAPTKLKMTQIVLLSQIDSLGGPEGPTLASLADDIAIGISALTHALRPLIRDGLVILRADAHDKRTKHAALTTEGAARLREGFQLWKSANHRVEAVLGSRSATTLRALADLVSSEKFSRSFQSSVGVGKPSS